ncbi:flagellar filament capping protein FliD [Sphingomonas sp.]|uniref:flagellar filament capping protein FliD n=1 Tax=Sphingomonas sp. TaxID=28214 RepID=UPI002BE5B09F|nr:flagellar filament capping protein FliD [Sphingomonas sp.]HWK36621.1 flagellar filament capping protein FliD [Sphingomonas sp.]
MVDSIAKTLGAGSGIDIQALVTSLVDAQYASKTQLYDKRDETLTAQVSAVSQLKSGITGFNTALQSLVRGGSLSTQPTSANTGIVQVSAIAGAKVGTVSSSVEVRALASAQVANTAVALPAGAHVGTGTLQFAFADGTSVAPIAIGAGDATLSGIAAKINAAGIGVTASVVSDVNGERLVMKGASGEAKAFTVTATETAGDEGLAALNVGNGATGTQISTAAADARVAIDGVEVRRATNTITDLIPGVRLDLQSAAVGTRVAIGSTPSTAALNQAVNDVVATYNELYAMLKEATDPVNGALAHDPAARTMLTQLRQMTTSNLTGKTDGSPASLASIGVVTNRDGTLSVDAAKLTAQLAKAPDAIEAMFSDPGNGTGLSSALNKITIAVTSSKTGLGAAATRYAKAQSALAEAKDKLADAEEQTRTRLTQQFGNMDARVAAYKSTQAFLEQQIAVWNAQ